MSEQNNNGGGPQKYQNPDKKSPKEGASSESTIIIATPQQVPSAAPTNPPAAAPAVAANDAARLPATPLSTMPDWLLPTGAKRRPVRRQGDKYDLKDNGDDKVDRTKAVLGAPDWEKLRMRLTTTTGRQNTYIFKKFEGIIPDSKWKDLVFIAAVNKWKDQVLRRTKLMEKSPKGGVERRTKYTEKERDHLHYKIKKYMKKPGTKLSGEDWEIIAKEHNEKWQGKKVKVNEKLTSGKVAKTESEIVRRSVPSLKIHFRPAQIRAIEAEIAAENAAERQGLPAPAPAPLVYPASGVKQEDQEESEEEDDEGEETEDGVSDDGEIDLGLEEESDDDMDGQRPAANTTGSILVSAS